MDSDQENLPFVEIHTILKSFSIAKTTERGYKFYSSKFCFLLTFGDSKQKMIGSPRLSKCMSSTLLYNDDK